jgi:hypothetical protein
MIDFHGSTSRKRSQFKAKSGPDNLRAAFVYV